MSDELAGDPHLLDAALPRRVDDDRALGGGDREAVSFEVSDLGVVKLDPYRCRLLSRPGQVWAPPGRPPGSLLGGYSLSEDARGGMSERLAAPAYAWVQFEAFSWRIDTAVVDAATADAVLVEWVWLGSSRRGCDVPR